MEAVRITYDPDGDTLYLTFGQARSATGYQLSDQLLLRVDPQTAKPAGITIFNYSVHIQRGSEIPLDLPDEEPETRMLILSLLTTPPVSHFLELKHQPGRIGVTVLSPSPQEAVAVSARSQVENRIGGP